MIKDRHIIVGFRSKATGFVYDFYWGCSVGNALSLFSRENPDGLPFLVSWGKLDSLYIPVLVPVDRPTPYHEKEGIWGTIKRILSGRWD